MEKRNFNGTQINQSATIVEQAGAKIDDCRNKILAYDDNGKAVIAADGTKPFIGVALIEAGLNDISGLNSGSIEEGEDIDIQIKDICYILANEEIKKGKEVTAAAGGLAAVAKDGDYVIGIALSEVQKDEYCRVQISKYQKNAAAE